MRAVFLVALILMAGSVASKANEKYNKNGLGCGKDWVTFYAAYTVGKVDDSAFFTIRKSRLIELRAKVETDRYIVATKPAVDGPTKFDLLYVGQEVYVALINCLN